MLFVGQKPNGHFESQPITNPTNESLFKSNEYQYEDCTKASCES
jgi:hypothetical protein